MTDGPVLVVTAHPDDPEFFFGATVAKLTDAGVDVYYLICSDGVLGSVNVAAAAEEIAATRCAEQRAAADLLGVRDVTFLGLCDGQLTPDLVLRKAIVREIRRRKARLVLTHFPLRVLDLPVEASHPDHVAVGETTLAAVYPAAGSPRAHPDLLYEGLESHQVSEVWLPGYSDPDYFVDATPFMERKVKAILCHRSQLDDRSPDTAPPWVYDWMRRAGTQQGYEYAEHFKRIVL